MDGDVPDVVCVSLACSSTASKGNKKLLLTQPCLKLMCFFQAVVVEDSNLSKSSLFGINERAGSKL